MVKNDNNRKNNKKSKIDIFLLVSKSNEVKFQRHVKVSTERKRSGGPIVWAAKLEQ